MFNILIEKQTLAQSKGVDLGNQWLTRPNQLLTIPYLDDSQWIFSFLLSNGYVYQNSKTSCFALPQVVQPFYDSHLFTFKQEQ